MQVKSIAEHSAILSTFIKLPFVIMIFVLSIFEWPFYTGFMVRVFSYECVTKKSRNKEWLCKSVYQKLNFLFLN